MPVKKPSGKQSPKKTISSSVKTKKDTIKSNIRLRGRKPRRSKARDASSKLRQVGKKNHTKLSKKEHNRRTYLKNAPEGRIKRILWRLHPKRVAKYWFSKRGGKMMLKLGAAGFIVLVVASFGVYAYFRSELPNPDEVNSKVLAENTRFYDRTGKTLLFELSGDQNRRIVKFKDMSPNIKEATIAIEDQDFYQHGGFSLRGITRAFINNALGKTGSVQGGSTITQQYVKNSFLTKEKSYTRKIKELILSVELERIYSKDEILNLYLNEIPYGGTIYGVESAAQNYFDKSAKDLTVDEAAFLASIPQQPGLYNPCDQSRFTKDQFLVRQDRVISNMKKTGDIDAKQAKDATEADTLSRVNCSFNPYKDAIAPHFVDEVQKQLLETYGQALVRQGGLEVKTTLDLPTQTLAEKTVKDFLPLVDSVGGDNMALTAGDQRNGQIMAMVGSREYGYKDYGSYNAATALRQPGSSFKPYAYAELFETGKWGPGSTLYDLKTDFNGYVPLNFNEKQFNGAIPIRRALGQSLNIPAVKALHIAGIDNVIAQAKSQGISSLNDRERYGLAIVLGAGEVKLSDMVTAYGSFATNGVHYDQTYILKVTNSKGEVLQENNKQPGKRVLDDQVAYLIGDMLSDRSVRAGVLNGLKNNVAVKTGTTSDVKDFWTMGYSDYITAGVWVGNHDNKRMGYRQSSLSIAPIFVSFMNDIHAQNGWEGKDFEKPKGLKQVTLDLDTGKIPTSGGGKKTTDLFPSYYTPGKVESKQQFVIDTVSGKLATDCTPANTREQVSSNGIDAEIPSSDPMYASWLKPIRAWAASRGRAAGGGGGASANASEKDDIHKCDDTKAAISSISATDIGGGRYRLTATVSQGTHALESVNFSVDGAQVGATNASGSGAFSIETNLTGGSHNVSVKVVDKAKYEVEGSSTVTVAGASNGFDIIGPSGNVGGGNKTLKWTSEPSASNYLVSWNCSGGPSGSTSTAGTSYSIGGVSGGKSCTFTITSSSGTSKSGSFST